MRRPQVLCLFHATPFYLGRKPVLVPRVPDNDGLNNGETRIERICVAPSVSGAYIGIGYDWQIAALTQKFPTVYIYCVETAESRAADKTVLDRAITRERWLLNPHRFTYVCKMPTISARGYVQPWYTDRYKKILFRRIVDLTFLDVLERRGVPPELPNLRRNIFGANECQS